MVLVAGERFGEHEELQPISDLSDVLRDREGGIAGECARGGEGREGGFVAHDGPEACVDAVAKFLVGVFELGVEVAGLDDLRL